MAKPRKISKILLVEDDEGYAILLERLFERAGLTTKLVWFPNGQELFDYIGGGHLNDNSSLLLLDLNLPVMSGFEILESVRHDYTQGQLPVIVISTTIRDKDTQRCLELGANSFLKKPISYNELTSTAKQLGLAFNG